MKGAKGERDKGVPTLPPGGPAYTIILINKVNGR